MPWYDSFDESVAKQNIALDSSYDPVRVWAVQSSGTNIVYYYTPSGKPVYLNSNSSDMFSDFINLITVDISPRYPTYVENV